MRILRIVSRILIGIVFMFSGFVKAVDPLGTAYKFHDYFHAFNIGFLYNLSLPLAIILFSAEFVSGFSMLTGVKLKTGIIGVFILLSIFTPLTLILALTNPVSDCGCFGDAIHLTNWQTFGKNIILFLLLIPVFRKKDDTWKTISNTTQWIVIASATGALVLFSLFNLRYLPLIDFLPYSKGTKIADKMIIPPGKSSDVYKTTFVYEKNGIKKDFGLDNYPANDSTWKFVDQKSVLTRKGYVPPIHDFQITSMNGEDITGKILSDPGYSLLMISKKLGEAKHKALANGFKIGNYCDNNGIHFYILTSSGTDEINNYENGLTFCSADETTLKTMVRSNPGYILIKNGIIIEKWSWADVPAIRWFGEIDKQHGN